MVTGNRNILNSIKGITSVVKLTAEEKTALADRVLPANVLVVDSSNIIYLTDGVTAVKALNPLLASATKLQTARSLWGNNFDGSQNLSGNIHFTNDDLTGVVVGARGQVGGSDFWRVGGGATASNSGFMELATADDGNEPIYVRQYIGEYATITRTATLLDASGNTQFPGTVTATGLTVTGDANFDNITASYITGLFTE